MYVVMTYDANSLSMGGCRYASLYFCICIDPDDNELEVLEITHHYVEILDRYFGSVSPLVIYQKQYLFEKHQLIPLPLFRGLLLKGDQLILFRFANWT